MKNFPGTFKFCFYLYNMTAETNAYVVCWQSKTSATLNLEIITTAKKIQF